LYSLAALLGTFDLDNDQAWNLDEYSTAMEDKDIAAWFISTLWAQTLTQETSYNIN